ncbi:MAG: three-Cys-motif partner protein TcmP [Dehalococcoidia bacterium]|nr:three-Cys-motif partner protein TcmP [Dehalococcoidia bacterium]
MATGDLVVASDGKLAIEVGPWAKDKLHYISRYCYIFNMGMKDKWSIRTYIDLFAGPGMCLVQTTKREINGSPLLALSCKVPFTHYFFNDIDPDVIKSLKVRTAAYSSVIIDYFNKDCNVVVDELLRKLPLGSLDFCFIDPFNWEINFDSIRKLTENRRMDLALTFHIGNIKRVADNPPRELISFFPDANWQQEYAKAEEDGRLTGRVLLDAYERGLRSLRYKEIKDYVLAVNTKNVPLYYLVFASKHRRGADFWDKIAGRSAAGQLRMPIVIEEG